MARHNRQAAIDGTYTLANFSYRERWHGGTLLTDPPAVTQKPRQCAGQPSATATVLEINTPDSGDGDLRWVGPERLWLDQPSTFTGTVSGFGAQDGIDLPGIAFDAQTTLGYSPNSNGTGGTLSVTDGAQSAKIALLGNYMASSFALASDNHGGTMVVDQNRRKLRRAQMLLTSPHHA